MRQNTAATDHEMVFPMTFNWFTDNGLYWAKRHFFRSFCSRHKWQSFFFLHNFYQLKSTGMA